MDVLILAGGKCDPELAAETGVEYRALLPFQGKPMLDTVMAAVQGVGRIILVSDFSRPNVENVPAGASFVGSIENGIKAVQSPTFLLVMADIP
ncbi:MAG: NTP transferase domain-containing protein, partial [Armatimonadetes bacterium]|nr:NTP transferase domain-containing protein [Armatimonadota bacterium]